MLTKSSLVESVAKVSGLKKKDSEAVVADIISTITNALASGEKVQLTGFGTFEVKDRPARKGRNPQTGKSIKIPASKRVSFSAGKTLKDTVNK